MSDVRAYVPGQTGTIADVVEQGPDLRPVRPAGPDGFKPAPSLGELFSAAKPEALRSTSGYDDAKISEGYAPILDALGLPDSENPVHYPDLEGRDQYTLVRGQPSSLATSANQGDRRLWSRYRFADRQLQEQLIVERLRQQRLKNPDLLAGVPDTVEGLHDYFEQQQAQKRSAAGSVLARGSGFGRTIAGLGAGFAESATHEPAFLPTLLIGGGGASSVLQAVGRDALLNGILSAGQLPVEAHNMAENGEHLTVGDVAGQVIGGAVVGGAFGGTVHLGTEHLPPLVFKAMPESVQNRWASRMKVGDVRLADVLGDMDNRELAGFARSTLGDRITPDQKAAADVLESSQELGEASPFEPGPAGDTAHDASLADTIKSIVDGVPREPARGPFLASSSLTPPALARRPISAAELAGAAVPHDIVEFFKSKGADDAHAYAIAAGIAAESRGGDHTVVNPKSGAIGLGQWLGSRKAALIERYGPNPTRLQQLEFLWHELTGGDPGGRFVLEAKEPGQILDAYIRRFMRPAAGAETAGDLERGMAALGRKGEIPEGAPIGAGDEDAIAAARQAADDAEREAIDLSSSRDADAELGRPHELETADYPILKRSLFESDQDWFEAQLAFYRSEGLLGGPERPAGAAAGPQESETGGRAPEQPEAPSDAPGASQELVNARRNLAFYQDRLARAEHAGEATDYFAERVAYFEEKASRLAGDHGEIERLQAEAEASRANPLMFEGAGPTPQEIARRQGRGPYGSIRVHSDGLPDPIEPYGEGYRDRVNGMPDTNPFKAGSDQAHGWKLGWQAADANGGKPAPGAIEFAEADRVAREALGVQNIRIDDPELKAFDEPGGQGAKDQVESLEHDARMEADQRAQEHLDRRFAELGPQPKKPQNFGQAVTKILLAKSKKSGLAQRIDAEDAISHGVDADAIYLDPKARYPRVKVNMAKIFASSKAPLRSRAKEVKLHSLDWLGDQLDPRDYGIEHGGRLEPEEIGQLLRSALVDKSDDALDRSDPHYQDYFDWLRAHHGLMQLEGEPTHPLTGETLPEAQQRAESLRESFPAPDAGGSAGTHNLPNSAPVPEGGTRGELRVKIFNALMAKPARAERQAHLVLGPPAAGKSSFAEPLAEATGSRLIDADEAKAQLPEFENGIGAAAVHEESSRLAAVAADASIRNGDNIVLPIIGRTAAGVDARIQELFKAGYNVHVHLVDLPNEKAVERAINRFAETGRLVDPEYVRQVGEAPRETFSQTIAAYKDKLGGYLHVTNDVPFGQKPELVDASSSELAARLGYDRPAKPGESPAAPQAGSKGDAGAARPEDVRQLEPERRYQLSDNDDQPKTLGEILSELDKDREAAAALRSCAAPPAAAA